MDLADTASSLMAAHARLRANGFGIVSVVSSRSPLDARVWLGQRCQADGRVLTVAPSIDPVVALQSYYLRIGARPSLDDCDPNKLPVLLLPGPLLQALPAAAGLVAQQKRLPVAIACGLAEIVESLLDPAVPLSLVSTALEGLVPTDDAERRVLATVAEGRKLQPFLRGACEGLVYYMLQARPETRGLFEPNMRIENTDARRSHEVDLLCVKAKLVIEIDGPEHGQLKRKTMDARKQTDLERQGYSVRRFSNEQVIEDPVGVWRLIQEQLAFRSDSKESN